MMSSQAYQDMVERVAVRSQHGTRESLSIRICSYEATQRRTSFRCSYVTLFKVCLVHNFFFEIFGLGHILQLLDL